MHASTILRRCLPDVLNAMHAARRRVLLQAVEALVTGRRLTLTDLARAWPGATWMHAPLKALDRLLSNGHLHRELHCLQQALVPWLIGSSCPPVLVDWSDLKQDGRWCLLRASIPMKGRALTLYERLYPIRRQGQPQAQREFLADLHRLLPAHVTPVLVTDAGFRSDWYRAVSALGWHCLGRLRNNTKVRSEQPWQSCRSLHDRATVQPRDLGPYWVVQGDPLRARLVLAKTNKKRRDRLACGKKPRPQAAQARKSRKSASEPWLLVTSLTPEQFSARALIATYAKRMQIEEAFRDLKSTQYGMGLEHSQSRDPKRLAVLLLLHTLATFAAWVMGNAANTSQSDRLTRQPSHRSRYSCIRRGLEWLRRTALPEDMRMWISPACLPKNLALLNEQLT